jgi:hypothetical protein
MSKAALLVVAAGRLIRGHGKFTLHALWRKPTSEQTAVLRRAEMLNVIAKACDAMSNGDDTRVRDRDGKLVLSFTAVPALDPRRAAMVKFAQWGVAHKDAIHYSQARPIDFHFENLPWDADCSGSTIAYAKAAGADDPSGNHFNGSGSTDSILAHAKKLVSIEDAQPGDMVLWHNGLDGKHVAVVIKPGKDPLLASHGFEGGPISIRFSDEDRYHASETATALSLL